ncbi:amidohydrolase, partial [Enterococcus faecalis]
RENACFEGPGRCFIVASRKGEDEALQRYAEQTAAIYGGTAPLDYQYGTLPVINHEQDALFAETLIKENFGEAALRQEEPA